MLKLCKGSAKGIFYIGKLTRLERTEMRKWFDWRADQTIFYPEVIQFSRGTLKKVKVGSKFRDLGAGRKCKVWLTSNYSD